MNSIKISFTLFILFSDIFENKLAETGEFNSIQFQFIHFSIIVAGVFTIYS